MRALVTGGAGFIGSNLVEALIARGDEVVVLDDLCTGYVDNVPPSARFIKGSITDPAAVAEAVQGCDVVFHLAAHRAVLRSVHDPVTTTHANVDGLVTVLWAAHQAGARRFVSSSSSSIYGGAAVMPTTEDAPALPRSPYAVGKLAGEHFCRVFAELYGMETVSLRYFNVYGPRQRPDSAYAAVIPLFIEALTTAAPPEVHGTGAQSRDFTYVGDAVAANLAAATAPAEQCSGKAYNIAGGRAWSLLDLLEILGELLEVTPRPVHTSPRPGDVMHTLADLTRAASDLAWAPTVDFRDGLERTLRWFEARKVRLALSS